MFQVTVLGCGGSRGVPEIGCNCNVCRSKSGYNKRTRSSILISNEKNNILVDFGFDIKYQIVRSNINKLDAAILTHDHADHVAGSDNLRVFPKLQNQPLNIFTDYSTATIIEQRYQYLFSDKKLIMNPVGFFDRLQIGNISLQLCEQDHGSINSIGVRIRNFVYSTDVAFLPSNSEQYLLNISTWILDCAGDQSSNTHIGLDRVLEWQKKYKPKKILLTNISTTLIIIYY